MYISVKKGPVLSSIIVIAIVNSSLSPISSFHLAPRIIDANFGCQFGPRVGYENTVLSPVQNVFTFRTTPKPPPPPFSLLYRTPFSPHLLSPGLCLTIRKTSIVHISSSSSSSAAATNQETLRREKGRGKKQLP
jgi:hypothetical protein